MSEVAVRTPAQEVVVQIRSDQFKEQVAMALPDNVPASRFVRATVTALLDNPGIAEAEHDSFFAALLKCANDGLLPDGREAALVIFKDKQGVKRAQYISMIGGLRKIAAEYGWSIRTSVVYQADEFDYELGLDIRLTHRPAPVTADRGAAIAAYAIANHRDGRREIEVMSAGEIEKVRQVSRAKDQGPWRDWTDRMWEKTVGRRIFPKLALDPGDRRIASVLDAAELPAGEAAQMLYGPSGETFAARELEDSSGPDPADDGGVSEVAAGSAGDTDGGDTHPASAPAGRPEPQLAPDDEEKPFKAPASIVRKAGNAQPPTGAYREMSLQQILDKGETGIDWITWALEEEFPEEFTSNLRLFCQSKLPDVWAAHENAA